MRRIFIVIGVSFLLVLAAVRSQAQEGWLATTQDVGFITKINVKNLKTSTDWYVKKIGLVPNPVFDTDKWSELDLPGMKGVGVGLNLHAAGVGTGGATITFVVKDIKKERQSLIAKGVTVSPVQDVGKGVLLAFFKDPDGNQLGLRQNGPPKAAKAGG